MNSIIEKIRENKFLSVFVVIALGILILVLIKYISIPIVSYLEKLVDLNFYTKNTIGKFVMLSLSLLIILVVNKGSLKGYGFSIPNNIRYFKLLWVSTLIIIVSFIFGMLFFNVFLKSLFSTQTSGVTFPENNSILELVLTVWIWSSICEEVFTRGFIQGFLHKHINVKFLRLSLPIWVSGLFFGTMHSMLAFSMDSFFVSFIVFNTTVIGLLAAYYREKSDSIYPAIFIHFWANVIGSLPFIIIQVFDIQV